MYKNSLMTEKLEEISKVTKVHEHPDVDYNEIESITSQEYKCLADIKYLAEQQNVPYRTPVYGIQSDLTFEDYQNEKAALMRNWSELTKAQQMRFGSPSNFLEYCANPENYAIVEGRVMFKEEAVNLLETKSREELIEKAKLVTAGKIEPDK